MDAPRTCDTLILGRIVTVDPDRRVIDDGYVAVRDGRIADVGAGPAPWTAAETLGGPGFLVLPGLVNTHTHLVQGCIRGMAEGTTFEERLHGFYYPMTGACDEERSYASALPPVLDLLRSGVTTTADDHFTHRHKRSMDGVLRAVTEAGIRVRAARLTINEPTTVPEDLREDVGTGLAETERIAAEWNSDTVSVTAGSIGITYCTPEDLHALYDWTVAHGEQFDIHAPSYMDKRYLAERRGWTGGSIEWLDSEGMLAPHVIAIHAQGLVDGEAERLAAAGASVSLVPDMELILGMVTFDSRRYDEAGVTTSLGLDGPVVAYGQTLWMGMRGYLMAQRVSDSVRRPGVFGAELLFGSPERAIELATIGGARALGMAERIGSLETGKDADVLVVDLSAETTLSPPAALLANLVWSGGPSPEAMHRVLVRGRTVLRDGEPVGADRRTAVANAAKVQRDLLEETGCGRFVRGLWT
nr:5'-deoxyadenosine deaminase [Dactylosporangium thailandense]